MLDRQHMFPQQHASAGPARTPCCHVASKLRSGKKTESRRRQTYGPVGLSMRDRFAEPRVDRGIGCSVYSIAIQAAMAMYAGTCRRSPPKHPLARFSSMNVVTAQREASRCGRLACACLYCVRVSTGAGMANGFPPCGTRSLDVNPRGAVVRGVVPHRS